MALTLGDNFSYQGAKPLDGRLKYDTLANMKAVADATMYDGCLAYCEATDKTYQWKSANTVDADTGRWREFSSGGGGGAGSDTTAYHTSDTAETTLADSDKFPFYDASASAARHSTWSNLKAKLKSYFDTVYDLNKSDIPMYGTSSTTASTAAKTASVTRGTFTLVAGAKVSIKFTYTNTASEPTLNVGSTGAKNIKYIDSNGTVTTPTTWWGAGDVVSFVYDGTQWLMQPVISLAQPNVTYGFTPVGTIISVMGKSAPTNYLKCDGSTYNISAYPELANYFYAQFGSKNYFGGNGTTTFAVPDLRGEFLRGTGTNSHANQGSGATVGVHQDGTSHLAYGIASGGNVYHQGVSNTVYQENPDNAYNPSVGADGKGRSYSPSGSAWDTTAKVLFTSRPTNTSVLYCIAVKDIYMNPADTYSTSEQVIGTWVSGEKLYQKTFSGTVPTVTTQGTSVDSYISIGSSVARCISCEGDMLLSNGNDAPIPYFSETQSTEGKLIGINALVITNSASSNKNTIRLRCNTASYNNSTYYITIKYTKTT